MKLFYSLIVFSLIPLFSFGQCGVTVSHTNTSCFGGFDGTAVASPTGTSPFTYLWSPGSQTTASINNLTAGVYTVTMTDALACVATATVAITSPIALSTTITTVAPSCGSCCDGSMSVIVSGGNGPYSYQWMPSVSMVQTANFLCSGTYSVCVTDASGCSTCNPNNCSFCQTSATLSPTTGQSDVSVNNVVNIYPNPAAEFVTVKESFGIPVSAVISVSNVLGKTVYTKSVSATSELNETINIAEFTSGVYFISIKTATGTSVRRFVKE